MTRANSLAARDRGTLVHPFTNLAEHAEAGPLVIERGEGVYVIDAQGHRYLEGMAGLWCAALGFSEARLVQAAAGAAGAPAGLPPVRRQVVCGRRSSSPSACSRSPRCRWPRRCSSIPAPRPTTPRSSSCATITMRCGKPEKPKIISRVRGLSRRDAGGRQPDRAAARASRLRPAAAGLPARRLPALLPLRPARRERGAVRLAAGREPGAADPARGPGHGRRLHRRAADGGGRRDPAAGRLFRARSRRS